MSIINPILFIKLPGPLINFSDICSEYLNSGFESQKNLNLIEVINVESILDIKGNDFRDIFSNITNEKLSKFQTEFENSYNKIINSENQRILNTINYELGNAHVIIPASLYGVDSTVLIPLINSILNFRDVKNAYNLKIFSFLLLPDFIEKENDSFKIDYARSYCTLCEIDCEFEKKFSNYSDNCYFFAISNTNFTGKSICPDYNIDNFYQSLKEFINIIFNNLIDLSPSDLNNLKEKSTKGKYKFLMSFGYSSIRFSRNLFYDLVNKWGLFVLADELLKIFYNKSFDNNFVTSRVNYFLTGGDFVVFDIQLLSSQKSNPGEQIFKEIDFRLPSMEEIADYPPKSFFSDFDTKENNYSKEIFTKDIKSDLNTRKDFLISKIKTYSDDYLNDVLNDPEKSFTFAHAFSTKIVGNDSAYVDGENTTNITNLMDLKIKILSFYADKSKFNYFEKQSKLNLIKSDISNKEKEFSELDDKISLIENKLDVKNSTNVNSESDIIHYKEELKSLKIQREDLKNNFLKLKEDYETLFQEIDEFERKFNNSSERQSLKDEIISENETYIKDTLEPEIIALENDLINKKTELENKYNEKRSLITKLIIGLFFPGLLIVIGVILFPFTSSLTVLYIALFLFYIFIALKKIFKFYKEYEEIRKDYEDLKQKKTVKYEEYLSKKNLNYKIEYDFLVNENALDLYKLLSDYFISLPEKIDNFKLSIEKSKVTNLNLFENTKLKNDIFNYNILQKNDAKEYFDKYINKNNLHIGFIEKNNQKPSDLFQLFIESNSLNHFEDYMSNMTEKELGFLAKKDLWSLINDNERTGPATENLLKTMLQSAECYINLSDIYSDKPAEIEHIYANNNDYEQIVKNILNSTPTFTRIENKDIIYMLKILLGFSPSQITLAKNCKSIYEDFIKNNKREIFISEDYKNHSF